MIFTIDQLINVHQVSACQGRNCWVHNPSDHPLKNEPLNYREDIGIVERICSHGVGHPDPDDLYYRNAVLHQDDPGIHGCDGCCVDNLSLD